MNPKLILLLLVSLFLSHCAKESLPPQPTKIIENGVVVWQEPLWKVAHDTSNYVTCVFYPYWQFDDKVIVDTYDNKRGGLRCMRVDTGEILWEKFFETSEDYTGEQILFLKYSIFNNEKGYIIIPILEQGDLMHTKLNINTGEVIWKTHLETLGHLEAYNDYYYCLVHTSDEVFPIYKVSIENGDTEYFFATTLPVHPNFDWHRRGRPHPLNYNQKDYMFIDEHRLSRPDSIECFMSLLDTKTMELLVENIPLDSWLSKVEVNNGRVFLFTGTGYKIFDMETLSFEREVKLIDWGDYIYHTFYNDKLIMGLSPNNTLNVDGHYVVDLNTHSLLYVFEDWVYPSAILDNVLYIVSTGKNLQAYNLNTGKRVLNFDLRYDTQFGVATYKNDEGKKFVVVGDLGYTYCFEGL
jgi:outer membrane protein assembly factor BamB